MSSQETELIWEEPPPPAPRGGRSKFRSWLDTHTATLAENPGRWAKFPEPAISGTASNWAKHAKGLGLETRYSKHTETTSKGAPMRWLFVRTPPPPEAIVCPDCDAQFDRSADLAEHRRTEGHWGEAA